MFGYIRAAKPELRMKEYDMYKAVYCSLCKKMGKQYGFFTRFTLSYDFTFLALLELSLADEFCGIKKGRCAANPLKKCNYCQNDDGFKLSSAAAVILLYHKLLDDVKDEKSFKKLGALFLKMFFSHSYKKAAKDFPDIQKIAKKYTQAQANTEIGGASLDDAAQPTSIMLSELFELCSKDEQTARILSYLGKLMGRFIYLLDCACDVESDTKEGKFNPLGNITKKQAAERIKPQIYIIIDEAIKTFELLEIKRFKDILGNIIYVGLEETMKKELLQ